MSPPSHGQAEQLRALMQRLFRRFGTLSTDATPCGKPVPLAHAHALMVLRDKGELSQRELGRELCIDKSNVTRLCARMVLAGHVAQRPSERDGRSRRVKLTARGKRVASGVDAASRATFAALLRALPDDRRDVLLESLRGLVDAVEGLPAPAPPEERKRP